VTAAIVAAANLAFPPKTVALRVLDREGEAVFERFASSGIMTAIYRRLGLVPTPAANPNAYPLVNQ
jgi:hypothetical protein